MVDPFPAVGGQGLAELRSAGLEVSVGLSADAARRLNAPYLKLVETGRPWTIAKWAMTLDGKIATCKGESRWISGRAARQIVHDLRGHVDAIVVGIGTALADDPLLTARPAGPRVATRVVLDTRARLPLASQLVRTAGAGPVLVATGPAAAASDTARLAGAGCEVICCPGDDHRAQLRLFTGRAGAAPDDQRAGGRGRGSAGQPAGPGSNRRGARLWRPNCLAARRPPARWPVWDGLGSMVAPSWKKSAAKRSARTFI